MKYYSCNFHHVWLVAHRREKILQFWDWDWECIYFARSFDWTCSVTFRRKKIFEFRNREQACKNFTRIFSFPIKIFHNFGFWLLPFFFSHVPFEFYFVRDLFWLVDRVLWLKMVLASNKLLQRFFFLLWTFDLTWHKRYKNGSYIVYKFIYRVEAITKHDIVLKEKRKM